MSKPRTKRLEETKLIVSSAPGEPVSHRVEKPWRGRQRGFDILQAQGKFQDALVALAELPAPDKLARISALAILEQLPEIAKRSVLSKMENEFLALTAALTSSSAKRWPVLVDSFLKAHGWKHDLRGSPLKHPLELEDRRRGQVIDRIIPRLKDGFDLKMREKEKRGYASDDEQIGPKLRKLGYDDTEVRAILRGRDLHSAACYYYRAKYEPHVVPKTILNSYRRFCKSVGRPLGR